jgi:hypothetical protein
MAALLSSVLVQLDVQSLGRTPHVIRASTHPGLVAMGMGRWVIVAEQAASPQGEPGLVSVVHDKTHDLFLLLIRIDTWLFANNELELIKKRKKVVFHEFVHGFAYMYNSTIFPPKIFCEIVEISMKSKMRMTSDDREFKAILDLIGSKNEKTPPDGHFRMAGDGFPGDYSELYVNLMLPYQSIYESMANVKQRKQKNDSSEIDILIDDLAEKEALDRSFVKERVEEMLPRLYSAF